MLKFLPPALLVSPTDDTSPRLSTVPILPRFTFAEIQQPLLTSPAPAHTHTLLFCACVRVHACVLICSNGVHSTGSQALEINKQIRKVLSSKQLCDRLESNISTQWVLREKAQLAGEGSDPTQFTVAQASHSREKEWVAPRPRGPSQGMKSHSVLSELADRRT